MNILDTGNELKRKGVLKMKKIFNMLLALLMVVSFVNMIPMKAFANMNEINSVEASEPKSMKDLVDIAVEDGRFKTLATALKAADLVDTLKGKGPFTVFAPTDEAFAKLPKETLNDLLKPENKEKLADILTYHVTPGKITSQDVVKLNGKEITMVNGKKAKIKVKNNEVFIDGAKVIITDIEGKNGVIHVIDTVIMPK